MRMSQSELERADAGLQMFADDVQCWLREHDRQREQVYGPRQIVKLRLIDIVRLIVVSAVALTVVYTVIWMLTRILPSW